MNKHFAGWNTDDHLKTFGFWNGMGDRLFDFLYGNFQEIRYLRDALRKTPGAEVLDVGCATGTTYRYLRLNGLVRPAQYLGIDLSEPAIASAKSLHPRADFRVTSVAQHPAEHRGPPAIVISRDTVLHQTDPLGFLRLLMSSATNTLIVRLRTRDVGPTEYDVEKSCQMHYNRFWMPYIVINTDELVGAITADPRVSRATINRSYEVLGGQNFRYLPKDLYFTTAMAAETAVMIEFGKREALLPEVVFEQRLEGQAYRRSNLNRYLALKGLDRLSQAFGKNQRGRILS